MTKNRHMYMSSEVGVTDLENHEVVQKVKQIRQFSTTNP